MAEYIDIHCHLLFGVDDGPQTLEESLALLKQEYDDGVRTIFLTPHYRKGMFESPPELRMRNFRLLQAQAAQQFPDLRLYLGCELHVTMELEQDLAEGRAHTMGETDLILLEFPESAGKRHILERCHTAMSRGYRPILAHAERCDAVRRDPDLLQRLADMGVYIQMNAGSIVGEEGLAMKWFCRKVMRRGLLHLVGTDAHNLKGRRPNLYPCSRYIQRILGSEWQEYLLHGSPLAIIEGSD